MKKEMIVFYSIAILLFLIGFFYDYQIALFFNQNTTPALTLVMEFISFVGNAAGIIIIFTFVFLYLKKITSLKQLYLSMGIVMAFVYFIKYLVLRPRPFELLTTWDSSFPSSHTASAFVALPILNKNLPKLKWVWIISAALVALSRLYLGVHYLSDVAAGAILGYSITLVILRMEKTFGWNKTKPAVSQNQRKLLKNRSLRTPGSNLR